MIDTNEYRNELKKQKQLLRKWAEGILPPPGFEARLRARLENIQQSFWGEISSLIPKLAPIALGLILLLFSILLWPGEDKNISRTFDLEDSLDNWAWLENIEQVSDEMLLVQTWDLIASSEGR